MSNKNFLTQDFNHANQAFTLLDRDGLIAKQDFIYYTDKKSNSNIFALAMPSYIKPKRSNNDGYYGHIHQTVDENTFEDKNLQQIINSDDPDKNAVIKILTLLAQYFDQYGDQLSYFTQDIVADPDYSSETLHEIKNVAIDLTYILQKYMQLVEIFPDLAELMDAKDSGLALQTFETLVKEDRLEPKIFEQIQYYGEFFATCFGCLFPILSVEKSLNDILASFFEMNSPQLLFPTNKYGFADFKLANLQNENE